MKNALFLLAFWCLSANCGFAQSAAADKPLGVWLSEDQATRIEIFKSGSTYAGKLLWAKNIYESDGKTFKKDDQNPDQSLRRRERKGLVIINGLTYTEGAYTGGTYYNVDSGSTYSLNMGLKNGKLLLRGYKGVPMLGKTFVFTRAQ